MLRHQRAQCQLIERPISNEERNVISTPIRRYVDTDTGQLHLRDSGPVDGAARPLVCLHMCPRSGQSFEKFMQFAGRERRVLAPDYHGYGESSPPPSAAAISIADYARTIWQAMDQLGIGQIDLLGHHTGSKVATEMIAQRPAAVGSVIFISASLRTEAELEGAPPLFEPIAPDSEGSRMLSFLGSAEKYRGDGAGLDFCYEFVADCMRAGGRYQEGNRAAFLYNEIFPERLREISQRVHVLNPQDDLYAITPRVADYLADCEVITLPGWGLGMLYAHAEETAELVSQLLSGAGETSPEGAVREDLA